jgi:hypothetical protein
MLRVRPHAFLRKEEINGALAVVAADPAKLIEDILFSLV